MIKGDFFPTPQDGEEANTGNKLTAQIQTLNMPSFSEAYWLGWIKYENIPSIYHLSEFSITDTAYVFTDATKVKNYNVGYLSTYNEWLRSNNAILYPTDPVTVLETSDSARYINKLDVMSTGIRNTYQIDFRVAMQGGTWRDQGFPINTMSEMIGYLNGDNTVTIQFQNHIYQTITKSFKLTDMTDGALEWEENGIQYVVTILGFHIGVPVRSLDENGNLGQYISPTPCIDIETESHRFISAPAIGPYTRLNFQTSFRWNTDTWADTNYSAFFSEYSYFCSGLEGSIPKTLSTETNRYRICGNMLVFNDSPNYTFRITRIYTIDDIKKFIGLQIRIVSQNVSPYTAEVYGYIEDDGVNSIGVYAPLVTEDNEFTTDLITGNLSDDSFKSQLRDWQYDQAEWENNDYEEGQWPDPGGMDVSSTGATIIPNTHFSIPCAGGFITQYALTGEQVGAFGHQLWANFLDPDFLKSVFTTIANDLSITPSDILKYIVSLRAFPFSLVAMPSYDPHEDANIYFGRGIVPINLSKGIVGTIDSYNEGLEAGFIEIPRTFNDFRDFEPYSSVHVYVPFCGAVELIPSEVVGHQLFLYYSIDMSTGACQVTIEVASEAPHPVAVLTGNIGATVQMSASNMMEVFQKVGGAVASIFSKVAGDIATAVSMQAGYEAQVADGASYPELRKTVASNFASAVKSEQGIDSISGLTAGASSSVKGASAGFSSMQQTDPYAIVQTRYYQVPENYGHVYGYPCNYKLKLEYAEGFTVCKNVDLEGVPATQDELTLIESLLQSGVYF